METAVRSRQLPGYQYSREGKSKQWIKFISFQISYLKIKASLEA